MPLNLIGYAYGKAAQDPGCEKGPIFMRESALLQQRNLAFHWLNTFQSDDTRRGLEAEDAVAELNIQLAKETYTLTKQGSRFLTLGGDHSCAIGTWSGAARGLDGPLGLLWVDAHLDSHTPDNSISKNIHGMPLAVLLGYGFPKLTAIASPEPKISPENIALIGIRSFEESEYAFLQSLGVKIFYMENIRREGLKSVMQKALHIISAHTKGFGISIDLDGLDPEDAPGVASKEANGINSEAFLENLKPLVHAKGFIGAEIAEFNPSLDKAQKTEKLIVDLLEILC